MTTTYNRWFAVSKRSMDLAIAVVALILLSPLFFAIALLIKLDSPGPVFFYQKRLGKNQKEFNILKFRSMYVDIDSKPHEENFRRYAHGIASTVGGNTKVFKLAQDPRVTRVGGWLRSVSLDEFPQLLNVLKGNMSLVGPRPPIPYELVYYQDWHYQRFDVLPGMTGMWQVSGRSHLTFDEMMKMDCDYAHSQSLRLDLKLLLLTIPTVLTRDGAY